MEPYSGIEVVPPERLPVDRHVRTDPDPQQHRGDDALPEAVPLEYKNYNIQAAGKESGVPRTTSGLPSTNRDAKRRCGLPLRLFYTILAVAGIVVIGAIAGGVAGGLSSSSRQNDASVEPNGTAGGDNLTTATNSHIFPTSKLSATNWTAPDGLTHRFVFFQDISGAIIARRWDDHDRNWNTNNLSDIFRTSLAPINPLSPSTPLASASSSFERTQNHIQLWYLTEDNIIASVGVEDLVNEPESWTVDSLDDATLEAYPGSQLAAAWNRCWGDCAGYWAVAYQRKGDAGINVANSSNFSQAPLAIEFDRVAQGSSLALTPEVATKGASVSRLTLMSESLATSTSGNAVKSTYQNSWDQDGSLKISVLPSPSPNLQFAITLLDNWRTVVFLALLPNGTVTGSYFRKQFIPIPSVEFRGGPSNPNFTAMATSEEAFFYGISQDEILQYVVNNKDPSTFDFVERVYP